MKKSYFGLKIGKAFSSPVSASEPSIMIGKILKYTLKVVSVLVAIVLLILLLLYMPFVQDFVKSEGFDYIQRKNLKKVPGAAPGFVVYHTNYSLLATPGIPVSEVK